MSPTEYVEISGFRHVRFDSNGAGPSPTEKIAFTQRLYREKPSQTCRVWFSRGRLSDRETYPPPKKNRKRPQRVPASVMPRYSVSPSCIPISIAFYFVYPTVQAHTFCVAGTVLMRRRDTCNPVLLLFSYSILVFFFFLIRVFGFVSRLSRTTTLYSFPLVMSRPRKPV